MRFQVRQERFVCGCFVLVVALFLGIAPASFSRPNPTGNAGPVRFRPTRQAALFRRADLVDPEEAPAKLAVRVARAARVDRLKPGCRRAAPGCQGHTEYGRTLEELKNAARRQTL